MSGSFAPLTAALADRYLIERELGQGGMATVYLARDLRHERKVAIKVLRPDLAAVIGAERFVREIRTISALQHPHILGLIDSGEVQGTAYYVMPFVEGESLRDRLVREKQLPIADSVRIATEVASALDYAHRHGVIHRDIKPENILLHDGQALVADFGIALAVSQAGGSRMTETGMSLGTPHYMSPEQAMGEREITARSDVYALGCVTYEMLTGDPPFTGSTAQAIVAKVLTEKPARVRQRRERVPESVEEAVLTALEKLPADRFASAAQFAEALGRPPGTSTGPAVARPVGQERGWRSTVLRVVIGAALVGLGVLLGRLMHPARASFGVTFSQKTFGDTPIFNARFAPDGKTIVYSTAEHGYVPRLRIIRPEYPESQAFGEDSTHLLAISTLGEMAVLTHGRYLGHRLFIGTLARMPLGGGAPREIMTDVREADWSPDGTQLALVRRVGGKDRLEYPTGHVLVESESYLTDLRVAPRGDRLAFLEHSILGDDRGLVVVVDRKGKRTVLGSEYSALEGLAWSPDGRELFFSGSEHGEPLRVYRAGLGGTIRTTLPVPGTLTVQAVSGNGQWLVTRESQPWRLLVRPPAAAADRDLSWLDRSYGPMLTADGRSFAFSDQGQEAGSKYAVMLRKTDGSPAIRLGEGVPVAMSPDERWILAMVPTTPIHYELYPTAAGAPVRLEWPRIRLVRSYPEFFPDGRSLLVCGAEPGKSPRCYRSRIEGGELEPVTPDSIVGSSVSPDGSAIVVRREGQTMIQPLTGGPPRILAAIAPEDDVVRWSPDGRALWVTRHVAPIHVDQVDVSTGIRKPVVTIVPPERVNVFQIASLTLADDPRVYAYTAIAWSSELYLVQRAR